MSDNEEGKHVINTEKSLNNNNDKLSVINTVIQYSKKPNLRLVKSFSITADKIPIYEEFCRIAEREAGSRGFSDVLLKAMEEYVKRHAIPNPQVTLDRSFNTGLPAKPYNVCCVPGCNRKVAYKLILQNYAGKRELFQVCRLHKEWRHPDFKFIIAMKEVDV